MTISLKNRFGEFILSSDEGRTLGCEIVDVLRRGEAVNIDLQGVRSIVSAFLNPAVGDLYADFPAAVLEEQVSFVNANVVQQQTIEAVRSQARRYYTDPAYRSAHDEAIRELFNN